MNGLATRLFGPRRTAAPRIHGDPATRIESRDRATALRVAAALCRHGGLPSPHDPRRLRVPLGLGSRRGPGGGAIRARLDRRRGRSHPGGSPRDAASASPPCHDTARSSPVPVASADAQPPLPLLTLIADRLQRLPLIIPSRQPADGPPGGRVRGDGQRVADGHVDVGGGRAGAGPRSPRQKATRYSPPGCSGSL